MPVGVSGRIVYDPEKDEMYKITCPMFGISKPGSGTIEEDIETLRAMVAEGIEKEFTVPPEAVSCTGYSLRVDFTVEGPTNHTLDEFLKDGKKKAD